MTLSLPQFGVLLLVECLLLLWWLKRLLLGVGESLDCIPEKYSSKFQYTESVVKFVFTEILVKFIKSISGREILVEFIFDLKLVIFGTFDPKSEMIRKRSFSDQKCIF